MTDIIRAEYGYNLQILCVFYEICTNLIYITHFWHLFVYLDTSSLREKGQLSTQFFFWSWCLFLDNFSYEDKDSSFDLHLRSGQHEYAGFTSRKSDRLRQRHADLKHRQCRTAHPTKSRTFPKRYRGFQKGCIAATFLRK